MSLFKSSNSQGVGHDPPGQHSAIQTDNIQQNQPDENAIPSRPFKSPLLFPPNQLLDPEKPRVCFSSLSNCQFYFGVDGKKKEDPQVANPSEIEKLKAKVTLLEATNAQLLRKLQILEDEKSRKSENELRRGANSLDSGEGTQRMETSSDLSSIARDGIFPDQDHDSFHSSENMEFTEASSVVSSISTDLISLDEKVTQSPTPRSATPASTPGVDSVEREIASSTRSATPYPPLSPGGEHTGSATGSTRTGTPSPASSAREGSFTPITGNTHPGRELNMNESPTASGATQGMRKRGRSRRACSKCHAHDTGLPQEPFIPQPAIRVQVGDKYKCDAPHCKTKKGTMNGISYRKHLRVYPHAPKQKCDVAGCKVQCSKTNDLNRHKKQFH